MENDALCVLCQQDLDHAACHRLKQFQEFVTSTTEQELRRARETFAQLRKGFVDLQVMTESVEETLEEIRIENDTVADTITRALATAEARRSAVVLALNEGRDLTHDCPVLLSVTGEIDDLADQIAKRVTTLRTSAKDETRKRMTVDVQELRARKLLTCSPFCPHP